MQKEHSQKNGITKKGLKYIILDTKCGASVTVMVLLKVGSRNEPPNFHGISHFIEHMFFKGNTHYKTTKDISTEITKYGSDFNAFTDYDQTGYYIKIPAEYVTVALDILSAMLYDSFFKDEQIKLEKGVVKSELKRRDSAPLSIAESISDQNVYKNTNYEHSIGGVSKDVKQYSRDMVLSYINYNYTLKNMCVLVVGKMSHSQTSIKNYIEKKFPSDIKYKFSNHSIYNTYKTLFDKYSNKHMVNNFMGIQKKNRISSRQMKTEQSYMGVSFPSYSYTSPDKYIGDLLGIILAGNMNSRLFLKIREAAGLAYNVKYGLDDMDDVGSIRIACDTFSDKKTVLRVLDMIIDELNVLKRTPVDKDELANSIGYVMGDIAFIIDDAVNAAGFLGKHYLLTNECITFEKLKKKYMSITSNDIMRVANEIFKRNKVNVAIVSKSSLTKNEISNVCDKLSA